MTAGALHVLWFARREATCTDEVYSLLAAGNVARYSHMPLWNAWIVGLTRWSTDVFALRLACAAPWVLSFPLVAGWLRGLGLDGRARAWTLGLLAANPYLAMEVANVRYQGLLWFTAVLAMVLTQRATRSSARRPRLAAFAVACLPALVHPAALVLTLVLGIVLGWPLLKRWWRIRRRALIFGALSALALVGAGLFIAFPSIRNAVEMMRAEGWEAVWSRLPKDLGYSRARPRPVAFAHGTARLLGMDGASVLIPQATAYATVFALLLVGVLMPGGRRLMRREPVFLAVLVVPILFIAPSWIVNAFHPRYYPYAALPLATLVACAATGRTAPGPARWLRHATAAAVLAAIVASHPATTGHRGRVPFDCVADTLEAHDVRELWVIPGHWSTPLDAMFRTRGLDVRVRGLHYAATSLPPTVDDAWILDGRFSRPCQRHHRAAPRELQDARVVQAYRSLRLSWYQDPTVSMRLHHWRRPSHR